MRRFVFASSCSMYGAADSGEAVDESRPALAADRLRGVEGARPRRRWLTSPRRLRPGVHAERDRLRRLAAPPARHRPEQPRRLGPDDRRRPDPQRRDAVAPARPRRGHRAGDAAILEAPEDEIRGQAYNVGRDDENYQVRELAEIVQRHGRRLHRRARRLATTRTRGATASTSASSRRPFRTPAWTGRPSAAPRSCSTPTARPA